ncbi:MAG: GlsB/YeaQ/YmgE family stress response membrane protein [Phenylobacterium sp.]|uniref:GlsB/YeaQ/YmgE family stress response membrane protein n=1 Tax=Phenylobacterium sp. TaxID=1871053 RepID=UPI00271F817E|nr:GlsB/YeaQ/YmgE family stress response membrane protein [Phenylobacterium sp.]MDO8902187.1 GlsB/YeaQ/YmgE family stress response membrane protein [Phenylobacterium sp.]MDP2212658.1 GlsB/YeaQ/YmgE family stress response membrane protein [Phenylobacterium sp.]
MSGVGILGAIIIGIFAGWIAEKVMKRNHGLFTNLVVGLVGALIGGFIASAINFPFDGFIGSLIVSTIGAILLLAIVGLIRRK